MASDSVDRLRRLAAKYWSPVISLGALGTAAAESITRLLGGKESFDFALWLPILVAVLGVLLIRYPRIASLITRLILPASDAVPETRAFRGPRPYVEADVRSFHGRAGDVGECLRRLAGAKLFILDGESGSGKTSFLHAGLLPKLRELYFPIVARTTSRPLSQLLEQARGKGGSIPEADSGVEALCTTLEAVTEREAKPLLICLDQFDELFTLADESVRDEAFAALHGVIEREIATVLISIRSDFLDLLLAGCRRQDPSQQVLDLNRFFTLQPFAVRQAVEVMRKMLSTSEMDDPISQQDMDDFVEELSRQLARPPRDKRLAHDTAKTVLPVELQIAGYMAESIGSGVLSKDLLTRVGGKLGLYRTYIESVKEYVWRGSGLDGEGCLAILRQLVSSGEVRRPAAPAAIAEALGKPEAQVRKVLQTLSELYVVRIVPGAGRDGTAIQEYELMHDHLGRVLAEAPDRHLQAMRDAHTRLAFWQERSLSIGREDRAPARTLVSKIAWRIERVFAQPIPFMEMLALRRYAHDAETRSVLGESFRGFIVRMLGVCVVVSGAVLALLVYQTSEGQRMALVITDAPIADAIAADQSQAEVRGWIVALAHAGRIEELKEVFQLIKSEQQRSELMALAGGHLGIAGSPDEGISLVVESLVLKPPQWSAVHERAIAVTISDNSAESAEKQYASAVEKLPALLSARAAMHAGRALLKAQRNTAAATFLQGAEKTASSMDVTSAKVDLLLDLATTRNDLLQVSEVRRPLNLALEAARQLEDNGEKSKYLAKWAQAAAELCCVQDARLVLEEATRLRRNSWSGGDAKSYEVIGQALARSGQSADIGKIAEACKGQFACGHVAAALFLGLLSAGSTNEALSLANSVDNFEWDGVVYQSMKQEGCDWAMANAFAESKLKRINVHNSFQFLLHCKRYVEAIKLAPLAIPSAQFSKLLDVYYEVARRGGLQPLSDQISRMSKSDRCFLEVAAALGRAERSEAQDLKSTLACMVNLKPSDRLSFNRNSQNYVAAQVCSLLVTPSDTSLAVRCASQIEDGSLRDDVLNGVAGWASLQATPEAAFKITDAITANGVRSAAVADVMIGLIKRGMLNDLSLRPLPTYADDRGRVKCALGELHANAGRFREARLMQQECTRTGDKLRIASLLVERPLASKNVEIAKYLQEEKKGAAAD